MYVSDRHDVTLAVKVALNPNTTNQPTTNIKQSAPNLVKMYVTIRSQVSSIMGLIRPELSELFVLELQKLLNLTFNFTLAFINVDQIVPNMVTIYMTMRSWMSSIMSQI